MKKIKQKAKEKIKTIQFSSDQTKEYMAINDYNSYILGIHNYYSLATEVCDDFQTPAFEIKTSIRIRLQERVKRQTNQTIPSYIYKKYGKSKEIRFIGKNVLLPIGYVRHYPPIHKPKIVNKYTVEGRAFMHKNLEKADTGILHYLMRNPIRNTTIEYNDNRISLFVAQKGKCSVTKEILTLDNIHCHHKIPKKLDGWNCQEMCSQETHKNMNRQVSGSVIRELL